MDSFSPSFIPIPTPLPGHRPGERDDKKARGGMQTARRAASPMAARAADSKVASDAIAEGQAIPPPPRPAAGPTSEQTRGTALRGREVISVDSSVDSSRSRSRSRSRSGSSSSGSSSDNAPLLGRRAKRPRVMAQPKAPLTGFQAAPLASVIEDHLGGGTSFPAPARTARRAQGERIKMSPLGSKIYAWLNSGRGKTSRARLETACEQLTGLLNRLEPEQCRSVIRAFKEAVGTSGALDEVTAGLLLGLVRTLTRNARMPHTDMAHAFAREFGRSLYLKDKRFRPDLAPAALTGFARHLQEVGSRRLDKAIEAVIAAGGLNAGMLKALIEGRGGIASDDQSRWWVDQFIKPGTGDERTSRDGFELLCTALADRTGRLSPERLAQLNDAWLRPAAALEMARRTRIMSTPLLRGVTPDQRAAHVARMLLQRAPALEVATMAVIINSVLDGLVGSSRVFYTGLGGPPDIKRQAARELIAAMAAQVAARTPQADVLMRALSFPAVVRSATTSGTSESSGLLLEDSTTYSQTLPMILDQWLPPRTAPDDALMAFLGEWCGRHEASAACQGATTHLIQALRQRPEMCPGEPTALGALISAYARHIAQGKQVNARANAVFEWISSFLNAAGPGAWSDEQARQVVAGLGRAADSSNTAQVVAAVMVKAVARMRDTSPERRALVVRHFFEGAQGAGWTQQVIDRIVWQLQYPAMQRDAYLPTTRMFVQAAKDSMGTHVYDAAVERITPWDLPRADSKNSAMSFPPSGQSLLQQLTDLQALDDRPVAPPDVTPKQRAMAALWLQAGQERRRLAAPDAARRLSRSEMAQARSDLDTTEQALAQWITAARKEMDDKARMACATSFQRRMLPRHSAADWLHDAIALGWRIGLHTLPPGEQRPILHGRVNRLGELIKSSVNATAVTGDPILQGWFHVIARPDATGLTRRPVLADLVSRTVRSAAQSSQPTTNQLDRWLIQAAWQVDEDACGLVKPALHALASAGTTPERRAKALTVARTLVEALRIPRQADAMMEFFDAAGRATEAPGSMPSLSLAPATYSLPVDRTPWMRALIDAMEPDPAQTDYLTQRSALLQHLLRRPDVPRDDVRQIVVLAFGNAEGRPGPQAALLLHTMGSLTLTQNETVLRALLQQYEPAQYQPAPRLEAPSWISTLRTAMLSQPLADSPDAHHDSLTRSAFVRVGIAMARTAPGPFPVTWPDAGPATPAIRMANRRLFDDAVAMTRSSSRVLASPDLTDPEKLGLLAEIPIPAGRTPLQLAHEFLAGEAGSEELRIAAAARILGAEAARLTPLEFRQLRLTMMTLIRDIDLQALAPAREHKGQHAPAPQEANVDHVVRMTEATGALASVYLRLRDVADCAFVYAPGFDSGADLPRIRGQEPVLRQRLAFLDREILELTRPEVSAVVRDQMLQVLQQLHAPIYNALRRLEEVTTPGGPAERGGAGGESDGGTEAAVPLDS